MKKFLGIKHSHLSMFILQGKYTVNIGEDLNYFPVFNSCLLHMYCVLLMVFKIYLYKMYLCDLNFTKKICTNINNYFYVLFVVRLQISLTIKYLQ